MKNIPNNPVKIGSFFCGQGQPLVIFAGPCVLESRSGALEIAHALKEQLGDLDVHLVFKASYDKANRTSVSSFRGLGKSTKKRLETGMKILQEVSLSTGLPVMTDVHETWQAPDAGAVCDILQIPAFLARQTDLLEAVAHTRKVVNVKKGQFMASPDMKYVVEKLLSFKERNILLCERGTFFGYGRLVNDFRSLPEMRALGVPVIYDATHSIQEPGGSFTRGCREMIAPLSRAATAVGVDGIFLETHPDVDSAKSDAANMLPLCEIRTLVKTLLAIRNALNTMDHSI